MKMGQLAQPVRVALTGRTASPGLFEVMEVLGRDRTLFRLRQGIEQASDAERLLGSGIGLDLDGVEKLILLWGPVGGSSSGRTSVSGSDYLGSIPSPPAKIFSTPSLRSRFASVPRWGIV